MKKIFLAIVAFIILLIGLWTYFVLLYPTTSPFTSARYFINHLFHPHQQMRQSVYGFLPYWRTGDIATLRSDILSEVSYFALYTNQDGSFATVTNNQANPGWRKWQSKQVKDFIAQTQIMGGTFSLTVTAQQNSIIEAIIQDKTAQATFIANLEQQIQERHLNGITIDFEYQGTADNNLRNAFTDFAKTLSTHLHSTYPNITLSLSIMPSETNGDGLFDLHALSPLFDRFIGMSYDFYGISSATAGPIAPMHGFKEKKFFFDVTTMYTDLISVLPANKILMGIPYYGWDWAVKKGKTIQSNTFPATDPRNYAAVLSYSRMRQNKDLTSNQCNWDDYAQEKWCWYTDQKTGVDHQVWFEDNKSIGIKLDYAKQNMFNGIAIWVLGYDNGYQDLWDMITKKLSQ